MKVMLYGGSGQQMRSGLAERLGSGVSFVEADYEDGPASLSEALKGCTAMVTVRYDAGLPAAPSLRLVQVPGVGTDEIDLECLPAHVTLCNVSGHGPAVAEYVVATLLARAINLCEADRSFRGGSWERSSRVGGAPHVELFGKRVGIVGYGLIGREVAARLEPFGVSLNVCNRSEPEGSPYRYWPLSRLSEMAGECDVLIVTVALTEATRGLIGSKVLSALPRGAELVNVARGPVVDEDALFDALEREHLGGAVLDVWWRYPRDGADRHAAPAARDFSKFRTVLMTPHISGWSEGTVSRRLDEIADNLTRLGRGESLSNVVRKAS